MSQKLIKNDIGLYRDDGLIVLRGKNGHELDKTRKEITQIYYKQEKYKKVIEYAPVYMDSVSSKRKSEFAKLIGDAYYYEKKYNEAIPYLIEFRKGVKATRVDNYQIGFAYFGTKSYQNAVKYLARASTKKDALSQSAYYHMAESYLKIEEKDYASNAFRAASKLNFNPDISENSLFNYAKLAYELSYNPYDEAIEAFHEYIEIYPNSPQVEEAYEFLIRVYMTTKNYEDALNYSATPRTFNVGLKKN